MAMTDLSNITSPTFAWLHQFAGADYVTISSEMADRDDQDLVVAQDRAAVWCRILPAPLLEGDPLRNEVEEEVEQAQELEEFFSSLRDVPLVGAIWSPRSPGRLQLVTSRQKSAHYVDAHTRAWHRDAGEMPFIIEVLDPQSNIFR